MFNRDQNPQNILVGTVICLLMSHFMITRWKRKETNKKTNTNLLVHQWPQIWKSKPYSDWIEEQIGYIFSCRLLDIMLPRYSQNWIFIWHMKMRWTPLYMVHFLFLCWEVVLIMLKWVYPLPAKRISMISIHYLMTHMISYKL